MNERFSFKKNKLIFLLGLLPILLIVFQTSRFWNLYDSSYILEHSYMISLGKIPYKDFILHTTPGTYFIQAIIIKVIGLTLYSQIFYCCIVSVLTLLLTFRILYFFNNDKWLNLAIALPVSITGGYGILTVPFYDPDCIFFVLVSIYLILSCYKKSFPPFYTLLAGFCVFVPVFFKQNTGLVYLMTVHLVFIIALFNKQERIPKKVYLLFISGTLTGVVLFVIYLVVASSPEKFFLCVFSYGYKNRLHGFTNFFIQNFDFLVLRNTAIWLSIILVMKYLKINNVLLGIIVFILALSPFYIEPFLRMISRQQSYYDRFLPILPATLIVCTIAIVYSWFRLKSFPLLIRILPVAVLGTITASFLSQGYSGSNYGIWPMFSILFAFLFLIISNTLFRNHKNLLKGLIVANSVLLTLSMFIYIYSNHRFSYLRGYDVKEKVYHSETEKLKGLSLSGDILPNMDNFFKFVKEEIPIEDPIIILPHEDPFYFATGRYPHFTLLIHDFALNIYPTDEILEKVRISNVKWMILKTKLQTKEIEIFENFDLLISSLKKDFILYKTLPGYEIYRKSG